MYTLDAGRKLCVNMYINIGCQRNAAVVLCYAILCYVVKLETTTIALISRTTTLCFSEHVIGKKL